MISPAEVIRAVNAAWFLFLDRRGAVKMFDTSLAGFWRSFQAIVLLAPIYAISVIADEQTYLSEPSSGAHFDPIAYFLAHALTLPLDWVALPLLLAGLAPALGIRNGYVAFVIARNWGALLTVIPFALLSLLEAAGLIGGRVILVAAGAALAASLRYSYLAARRTLGVPVDVAIGFVVLDFLVSLGIARGVAHLLGVEA
jgi:hypothetical protein